MRFEITIPPNAAITEEQAQDAMMRGLAGVLPGPQFFMCAVQRVDNPELEAEMVAVYAEALAEEEEGHFMQAAKLYERYEEMRDNV